VPTLIAANESSVLVDGTAVEGIQSIEYRRRETRTNLYALGSSERIGVVSGASSVDGTITVISASPPLDGLDPEKAFQISAQLKHGDAHLTVTFDECFLAEKDFRLAVGIHGETVYSFTAARVREETAS
jgi:hypothetical protein